MASEPSVGQPYSPPMGLRFSLGDPSPGATLASPAYQGVVIGAVGEEGDSRGAIHIRDHYCPEMVIIGEPSKWDRITLGFKGSMWTNYEVEKPLAHTAASQSSACEVAVQFWNDFSQWCQLQNPEGSTPFTQITPTLRGMTSESNGFQEKATLRIGVRLPTGVTAEFIQAGMKTILSRGKLTFEEPIEAYRAEKNTSLVRAFLKAIRQEGGQPAFSVKTGTADMNIVAPAWNVPAIAYGPGDSNLDHTPEEQISLSEYQSGIRVLAHAIEHLMIGG